MRFPPLYLIRSQCRLAEFLIGMTLLVFGILMAALREHEDSRRDAPPKEPSSVPVPSIEPHHRGRPPPVMEPFRLCDRHGGDQ